MNIKSLITPLLLGKEGVDDEGWKFKIYYSGGKGLKISATGSYVKVSREVKLERIVVFKLVFGVSKNGDISFERITIPNSSYPNNDFRVEAKEELCLIFKELINQ